MSESQMSINKNLDFIAWGVLVIMVLGGVLLLFLGYPRNNGVMIDIGWLLIILGLVMYAVEIFLGTSGTCTNC